MRMPSSRQRHPHRSFQSQSALRNSTWRLGLQRATPPQHARPLHCRGCPPAADVYTSQHTRPVRTLMHRDRDLIRRTAVFRQSPKVSESQKCQSPWRPGVLGRTGEVGEDGGEEDGEVGEVGKAVYAIERRRTAAAIPPSPYVGEAMKARESGWFSSNAGCSRTVRSHRLSRAIDVASMPRSASVR